jgi:hypothetical protein
VAADEVAAAMLNSDRSRGSECDLVRLMNAHAAVRAARICLRSVRDRRIATCLISSTAVRGGAEVGPVVKLAQALRLAYCSAATRWMISA